VRSNVKSKSKDISRVTPFDRSNARRAKGRKFESSAVGYLHDRYVGNDPEQIAAYEQEVLNADIARKIFEMRTKAGLSQRELAGRVGTSASAICRLEDGDYEGHSLSLLKRIAAALDKRVEIRFVGVKGRRSA
jgi:DNA-binding XRE family transcriptional regulator